MHATPNQSAGFAARKLRMCAIMCCWVLGLSLLAQVIGWSLATFTDMRVVIVQPEFTQPLVVTADHITRHKPATSTAVSFEDVIEPVPVHTSWDRFFGDVVSLSMATGTLSVLVLLPLMFVAVMLIASKATGRAHFAISALVWTAIVGALALPLEGLLDLPWKDGAFHSYERMVQDIAAFESGSLGSTSFYGRFLVLPLFCAAGSILIAWRFGRGVEVLMPSEMPHQFDQELEKETSNIRASTLHGGGRVAAALSRSVSSDGKTPTLPQPDGPNARSVSPGKPLKRLI